MSKIEPTYATLNNRTMKGIYLTQLGKQEIEDKIAELEENQKDVKTDFDWNKCVIEKNVYKTILSSATILPFEESWAAFDLKMDIISYPNGVIIQPKQ